MTAPAVGRKIRADYDWQALHLIPVVAAIAQFVPGPIRLPTLTQDRTSNVDLWLDGLRLVQHLRRGDNYSPATYAEYSREYALRSFRVSGFPTEIDKVMAGYGDYLFCGWIRDDKLARWTLCDLNVFRGWYDGQPGQTIRNPDGDLGTAWPTASMPSGFVIAESA